MIEMKSCITEIFGKFVLRKKTSVFIYDIVNYPIVQNNVTYTKI